MKHLRVTLDPGGTTVHPVYELLTGAEYVESARALHGNLAKDGVVTLLLHVGGDGDRFAAALDGIPEVLDHGVTPVADREFYCYIHNETTAVDGALFAAFFRESVVPLSPVEYRDDGTATFAVGGAPEALQEAVADAPPGVELRVEEIGDDVAGQPSVVATLSDRQREAAEVAVELGYYDVPRRASHEDVAEAMGCALSTAAEHLRKAESRVFASMFG